MYCEMPLTEKVTALFLHQLKKVFMIYLTKYQEDVLRVGMMGKNVLNGQKRL